MYRPVQPNWKHTMWKFQDFSAFQMLREINFGHFQALKTAILSIWAVPNFEFLEDFDIFKREICPKIEIQNLKNC